MFPVIHERFLFHDTGHKEVGKNRVPQKETRGLHSVAVMGFDSMQTHFELKVRQVVGYFVLV